MLQNAYFLAKIGADTAKNEQHFAEILPIGRRVAATRPRRSASDKKELAEAIPESLYGLSDGALRLLLRRPRESVRGKPLYTFSNP